MILRTHGNGSRRQRLPVAAALCYLAVFGTGCSNLQVETSSDADWVSDHVLYEGDQKKLFVNSEFKGEEGKEEEQPTKEDFMAAGDEAWNSGDTERALFEYLRALKLDDTDQFIYFKIGVVHEYRGNHNLAQLAYAKATELDPEYVPALERQGTMLLKQRKYHQARLRFERAIEMDQQRLRSGTGEEADAQLAGSTAASSRQQSATPRFDRQSPFYAYNGLGVIEDLEGRHHAAIQAYDIARQIAPGTAFIYNNMGYSSYLANDLEIAELLFRKAVAKDPAYKAAWRNLALLHVRRGEYEQAINILVSQVDDEASAYNTVGYLCMLDKEHDKAEYYLNKAIELSPVYFKAANENLRKNRQLAQRKQVARGQ